MMHADLFLRITNKHGHTTVEHFTVWDRDLFIEKRTEIARQDGSTITVITEKQFNEEHRA